jgi:hypothetical protein
MRRIVTWVGRIPWWVWLFLAVTQLMALAIVPLQLSDLDQALLEMPDTPEYAKVRAGFEIIRRDKRFQLDCAMILAPLFLGATVWRCSHGRPAPAGIAERIASPDWPRD